MPRDENGWRIPRPGTRSRTIYDMLRRGYTPGEIHRRLGGAYGTLSFSIWRIRHPEQANRIANGGPRCGRVDDTNPRMRRANWRV